MLFLLRISIVERKRNGYIKKIIFFCIMEEKIRMKENTKYIMPFLSLLSKNLIKTKNANVAKNREIKPLSIRLDAEEKPIEKMNNIVTNNEIILLDEYFTKIL